MLDVIGRCAKPSKIGGEVAVASQEGRSAEDEREHFVNGRFWEVNGWSLDEP